MSFSRAALTNAIANLQSQGPWRDYLTSVEEHYNERVRALLLSEHPDEALRGECRALHNLLRNIHVNNGKLT